MKYALLFAGLFMALAVHAQKGSLTEYPGTYKVGTGDDAQETKVELRQDKLTISGRKGSADLSMQKPDTFSVDEYGGEVIFLRNPAKQISGIKINIPAGNIDLEGTRVEDLTEYVGSYKVGTGDDADEVKVTLKDGILTVSGSKGSADLSRQKADTFNVEQYGGQVIFKRSANKVSGIKIDIPAGNINVEGEKTASQGAPAVYVQPAEYKNNTHTPFVKKGQTDLEAHQGGCGLMPCNTMLSFINAVKLGVNTLEMDCVISRDSLVVLSHDQFMDFTMRSPDGKDNITKENMLSYNLFTMSYDSIRKYDAGSRANPYFPDQKKIATYKPLLIEVIDAVERYTRQHHLAPMKYNIEIKSLRGDNVYHPTPEVFTDLVIKVLNEQGIADRVVIQSFDVRALRYLHQQYPAYRTSYLTGNNHTVKENLDRLGFLPDVYSPDFKYVTAETVADIRSLGITLIPWTIDANEDLQRILSLGVDGIITNYPNVAKRLINKKN